MASLIRACKPLTRSIPRTLHSRTSTTALLQSHHFQPQPQCRHASKKAHKATQPTSSSTFVPGSQVVSLDPAVVSLHGATDVKMQAAVDWYRKEVAGYETRAAGRVTPALLAPVRVVLPGKGGESVKLEEVATVGVREGTTLLVTVFEEAVRIHLASDAAVC
jgi:ribosome recycling factor